MVFHKKRLEPRLLPWQQYNGYHSVSLVIGISGAKFEEHCFNISGDILDSVFYYLILHCVSLLRTIFASLARARERVHVYSVRDIPQTKLDNGI